MTFYAHTATLSDGKPDPDQSHWQLLSEHLHNVAALAKQFANPIDLVPEAKRAALLHHDSGMRGEQYHVRLRNDSVNDFNYQRKEKAGRVLPRTAILEGGSSYQFNVLIRALSSEHIQLSQIGVNFAIDKASNQGIIAIELIATAMNEEEILKMMVIHMQQWLLPGRIWFAGVCTTPRRHPWDEQELLFPTTAWKVVLAETGEKAQSVAEQLFRSGCRESPVHTYSTAAKYVFAYAINKESRT